MKNNFTNRLNNISPIDGRYRKGCEELRHIFSEGGLTRYRLRVEIRYLKFLITWLCSEKIVKSKSKEHIQNNQSTNIENDIYYKLDKSLYLESEDAQKVWEDLKRLEENTFLEHSNAFEEIFKIEEKTRHDVKSVEIFLRNRLETLSKNYPIAKQLIEYVHFGLTSQDITTLAVWMQIRNGMNVLKNSMLNIEEIIRDFFDKYQGNGLLSLTHGQPATPTDLGKEFMVFAERIHDQLERLPEHVHIKFGGCIGNLNAHYIAYPQYNRRWLTFADNFVKSLNDNTSRLQFIRSKYTTQIDHYDDMADVFDNIRRVNVVCLDLCRDMWSYISRGIFKLSIIEGEVGSSTMPHKVNPIDFENAEGNLIIGNAIFDALSNKLPVSRLQRDLTDSTAIRNIGTPFSHSLIAYKSIIRGFSKIEMNREVMQDELLHNHIVIAEAIQQILRAEGIEGAYDIVKEITRKQPPPTMLEIFEFIGELKIDKKVKSKLNKLSVLNYTGIYPTDYK